MINVTDENIQYAESILLGENKHFDDERLQFITDFSTLDLQAVPGSGKTTALLAKLIILEKHLPLKDNRGILVISHTNTAVNEIKHRIGKYCPKLFSYPNFIGTIQSFVDVFLAIPCYTNIFKSKPFRIDNEIYDERVERYYNNTSNVGLKNYLDRQRDGLAFLRSIRFNSDWQLIQYINGTPENFKLKDKKTVTYKSLNNFKIRLLKQGYLHFDDAYFLAELLIKTIPSYNKILQKRFQYVFVDEMQDMDTHQYNLLEKLFFDNGYSESHIQRIGDINQAIFNGFSDSEGIWNFRDTIRYLNGSYRLNKNTASIVEKLALTPNDVDGRFTNSDGSEVQLKPIIFLFNNENKEKVIEAFASKIQASISNGSIPNNSNNIYQAVAWRKEHQDADKIGLKDYCPNFNETSVKTKVDYLCLEDYLIHFDKEKKTLESIRKNILNAFLRVFRIENIKDDKERPYSKRQLIFFLKSQENNEYETYKLNIYNWSIGIIKGEENIIDEIRAYLPILVGLFGKTINHSALLFLNSASTSLSTQEEIQETSNKFTFGNIEVQVGTVHSIKGQTHTSSLYLETFFERGYGNYESERLRNQFLGRKVSDTLNTNVTSKEKIKKSAKMAYVGFSRPTHLLCVGIHKDRFNANLNELDRNIWDVIEL